MMVTCIQCFAICGTVVADSWLECMTQFPAETRQLVVADEALVVEYNNLVTSHA